MTLYYLLNAVHLGATSVYRPGDLLDDTRDPIVAVQAAGGALMLATNAAVAAAAQAALKVRRNGGSDAAASAIMTAATAVQGGSGSGAPDTVPFVSPVVIAAGHTVATWDRGATPMVLTLGSAAADAQYDLILPANTPSSLIIAPEFGLQPGSFLYDETTYAVTGLADATKPHALLCSVIAGTVVSVLVERPALSVTAPNVTGAAVNLGSPSQLVVTTDRPTYWRSVTGLSITGTTQQPATIVSGDGTTEVTFGLSAPFVGGEVAHFVVGSSRTAASVAGNVALVTSSTSVSVAAADFDSIPGLTELYDGTSTIDLGTGALVATVHNAALAMAANGGIDWTLTQVTPANQPTRTAVDANFANARSIGASGSQDSLQLNSLDGLPYVSSGFTRSIVVKFPLDLSAGPIGCFWGHAGNVNPTLLVFGGQLTMYDGGAHDMTAVAGISAGVRMVTLTVNAAGHAILYINGVATGSAVDVSALANAPEAWFCADEPGQALQSAWPCAVGWNRVLTPTEVATAYSIAKNNSARGYGLA